MAGLEILGKAVVLVAGVSRGIRLGFQKPRWKEEVVLPSPLDLDLWKTLAAPGLGLGVERVDLGQERVRLEAFRYALVTVGFCPALVTVSLFLGTSQSAEQNARDRLSLSRADRQTDPARLGWVQDSDHWLGRQRHPFAAPSCSPATLAAHRPAVLRALRHLVLRNCA